MELTEAQITESKRVTELALGKTHGLPERPGAKPPKVTEAAPVVAPPAPLAGAPVIAPVVNEPVVAPVVAAVEPAAKVVSYDDMSDEDLEKLLAKRTKGAVKSLAELTAPPVKKTAEELAAEEAKQKEDSLAWAISSGTIKKADYDKALTERGKSKRDIAMQLFATDAKEENPKVSAEEIEEQFKDFYGETLDEDHPLRIKRQKLMDKTADAYLGQFSNIDKIYDDYKGYTAKEANKVQIGKQVDTVFETIPSEMTFKIPYKHADGTDKELEVSYTIDEADLREIKRETKKNAVEFLSDKVSAKNLKDEFILSGIQSDIHSKIFAKAIAKVMSDTAEKVRQDTEAHYKNIPVTRAAIIGQPEVTNPNAGKIRQWTKEEQAAFPKPSWQRN